MEKELYNKEVKIANKIRTINLIKPILLIIMILACMSSVALLILCFIYGMPFVFIPPAIASLIVALFLYVQLALIDSHMFIINDKRYWDYKKGIYDSWSINNNSNKDIPD